VSKTNSAKKSYPDIGPQSLLFPTSETLTAAPMPEPICLPEVSRVSPSHAPGSNEARKTTVSSGLKCLGLFERRDPLGLLAKMLAVSSTWRSTVCYLTWKTKGTPHKRLYYQLAPSTPRTNEIEFGLWPTARATEWMDPRGKTGNRKASIIRKTGWTLSEKVKLWPTPRSSPNENRQTKPTPSQLAGQHGMNLATAVNLLPTPTANRRDGLQSHGVNVVAGSLNPEWVTWLMGYPEGWLDISIPNPPTSPESLPESPNAPPS